VRGERTREETGDALTKSKVYRRIALPVSLAFASRR
jgi:hypothetical protein